MTYTQLITPNPHIAAEEGMCLQYVRQAFGLPMRYGSAIEAWNNSQSQHRDRDFPEGVSFPVWWKLAGNPYGHVAYVQPDGKVWSTSNLNPNPVKLHPNIIDVEAYYARYGHPLTYLGWTEDVAGYPVIAPAGIAAQGTITPQEDDVTAKEVWEYPITIEGKEYPANDVLRYARSNAVEAKEKADAAPGLAVQTMLATRLPAPDGSGKSYTIAEYITYGWLYSMKAKDSAAAIEPLDPGVLAGAIAEANASAVAAQLEITVKEHA
jgi:hypothetical protein